MDRKVKMKLSRGKMEALWDAYAQAFMNDEPNDLLSLLLTEINLQVFRKMHKQLSNMQRNYSFSLVGYEALAFKEYWLTVPVLHWDEQANVVIKEIIAEIDRASKQPKILKDAYHI